MTRRKLPARVAHDLRGSLSTILMWGQVAELDPDPDIRARALAEIRQAALAQVALIDRLSR